MALVRVVMLNRLVRPISESDDLKRPMRIPLAAPVWLLWEEAVTEERVRMSDSKDSDDMAPNLPRLVCEGREASVERLERGLRSLWRGRERVAGGAWMSRIRRRRVYHTFVTARITMTGSKPRGNPRAVGSVSAREPRLDIETEKRLKERGSRR
jgi:hypothetical protein